MQKLDPKAVWLFFIGSFLRGVLASMFLMSFGVLILIDVDVDSPDISFFGILGLLWLWIIIIPIIFLAYSWICAKLTYRFYMYEFRENGFYMERGIIWKKHVFIPYDKIQNVDIYRGLVARVLGLSDLRIQTAGASGSVGHEGKLPGLSKQVAEQVRDELINKTIRQTKT